MNDSKSQLPLPGRNDGLMNLLMHDPRVKAVLIVPSGRQITPAKAECG